MKEAFVHIGASKEAITEARITIMQILESETEQATKQKALDVLGNLCASGNNSFSNCSFTGQSDTNWKSKK